MPESTTGHTIDPGGVDHPGHYNVHPAGVECIDVVEHFSFNLGNAIKYVWRSGLKPDSGTLLDLEKAQWYIHREILRLTKKSAADDHTTLTPLESQKWYHLNGIECVAGWDAETGCCVEGGGPITPCPNVLIVNG